MKKLVVLLSVFVLMVTGCSQPKEEVKPIGIIGAMDTEVKTLIENLKDAETKEKAGLTFHVGTLSDKPVVIVQSGIGKVNAALCTQILIDEFGVGALINTGVAGGLYKDLAVGDVVVATQAVEHDFDVTVFGNKKGYVSGMHGDGEPTYFTTDKELAQIVTKVAGKVLTENKVYNGTVASGDIFVADKALKDSLVENFNAYAAEMEGAAIAHVAYVNDLPTTIIRSISDLASGEANVTYEEFEVKAAERSAEIVMKTLAELK